MSPEANAGVALNPVTQVGGHGGSQSLPPDDNMGAVGAPGEEHGRLTCRVAPTQDDNAGITAKTGF